MKKFLTILFLVMIFLNYSYAKKVTINTHLEFWKEQAVLVTDVVAKKYSVAVLELQSNSYDINILEGSLEKSYEKENVSNSKLILDNKEIKNVKNYDVLTGGVLLITYDDGRKIYRKSWSSLKVAGKRKKNLILVLQKGTHVKVLQYLSSNLKANFNIVADLEKNNYTAIFKIENDGDFHYNGKIYFVNKRRSRNSYRGYRYFYKAKSRAATLDKPMQMVDVANIEKIYLGVVDIEPRQTVYLTYLRGNIVKDEKSAKENDLILKDYYYKFDLNQYYTPDKVWPVAVYNFIFPKVMFDCNFTLYRNGNKIGTQRVYPFGKEVTLILDVKDMYMKYGSFINNFSSNYGKIRVIPLTFVPVLDGVKKSISKIRIYFYENKYFKFLYLTNAENKKLNRDEIVKTTNRRDEYYIPLDLNLSKKQTFKFTFRVK